MTFDYNYSTELVDGMQTLADVYMKHANSYSSTSRDSLADLAMPSKPVGGFLQQLLQLLRTDLNGDLKAEQPMLEDLAKVHMSKVHFAGTFTGLSAGRIPRQYFACVDVTQVTFSDGHQLQALNSGTPYQCTKLYDTATELSQVSTGNKISDAARDTQMVV